MRVFVYFFVCLFLTNVQGAELAIKFEGLNSNKGSIRYILFLGPEGYPDRPEKGIVAGSIATLKTNPGIIIRDLVPGEYAMTFIHDENDNDKLETNSFGLPTEGVGFSLNPRIFFGAPGFKRSSFKLNGDMKISVTMKYF